MAKSVIIFSNLVDALGVFFNPHAAKYIELFFNNADTDYAEACTLSPKFRHFISSQSQIRQHLCHNLYLIMRNLWQPGYPSTEAFLLACRDSADPLQIRLVHSTVCSTPSDLYIGKRYIKSILQASSRNSLSGAQSGFPRLVSINHRCVDTLI